WPRMKLLCFAGFTSSNSVAVAFLTSGQQSVAPAGAAIGPTDGFCTGTPFSLTPVAVASPNRAIISGVEWVRQPGLSRQENSSLTRKARAGHTCADASAWYAQTLSPA